MPLVTTVYIDGFNLYYGAVKNTRHKWLNLQYYFTSILPKDNVTKIKYFTAMVKGPTRPNQVVFLSAVILLPKVEIIMGLFKEKRVQCKHSACIMPGRRRFKTHEEKRTDVNIASHMLDDAYQGGVEHQVLVTGDSDLVPTLKLIRQRFPSVRITVVVPANDPNRAKGAVELRGEAHAAFVMPEHMLSRCQFPQRFTLPDGTVVEKPSAW